MAVLNMSLELLSVKGIPVYKSFYSDEEPTITHGIIELENLDKSPINFSIRQVRCLAGADNILIDSFFVYRLPGYDEENPQHIHQLPLITIRYEISFPPISARAYLTSEIQIEAELEVNGEVIYSQSPYNLVKRIKKRP